MSADTRSKLVLGLALAYVAFIFFLGSTPRAVVTFSVRAEDKWGHALAFGLMQWTHLTVYRSRFPARSFVELSVLAVVTASLVGGLLEVWQLLFPPRSSELLDWVADTVGAVFFAILYPRRLAESFLNPSRTSEEVRGFEP